MVVNVNVYFPAKDVKDAYGILEQELLPSEQGKPNEKPEGKPQSAIKFELATSAHAEEPDLAKKIAEIVRKMPDVVNAYKNIGARLGDLDKMRENGAVGEGRDGMLVIRDEKLLTPDQRTIMAAVNTDRKTIIRGMAKAIIRINRAPENEQNLNQVMPEAVEQFAAHRRDTAKKGWWIQSPEGDWTRK